MTAKRQRRNATHGRLGKPMGLGDDHAAVVKATSVFPRRVMVPQRTDNLFKSGFNNRKIGKTVTKGAWAGMPIYTLTLEERATCPRICEHWHDCLLPGSRVLTSDLNWVSVERLTVGQKIVGFDEEPDNSRSKRRRYRNAEVQAIGSATRETYEITASLGQLSASAGHLWLVRSDRSGFSWRRTDELKIGDEIQFLKSPWYQDLSYRTGRVRGFMEGEGYCDPKRGRLGWGQKPGKLIDEINADVGHLGYKFDRYERKSGVNHSDISLMDLRGGWREAMRFLGEVRPTRLVERAAEMIEGKMVQADEYGTAAKITAIKKLGRRKVVTIKTSTNTLVAEGFLVHNCYGNHMQWPARWKAGKQLELAIEGQAQGLAAKHPGGVVFRLHVLGDFYSNDYVELWLAILRRWSNVRVYGYTRREKSEAIGAAIAAGHRIFPDRWKIRWSERKGKMGTHTTKDLTARGRTAEGIVCPAQTEGDEVCCASCALCWSTTEPIVFINH